MVIAVGLMGGWRYKHARHLIPWWEIGLYGIGGIVGLGLLIGSSRVYSHEEIISEKHTESTD